MDFNDLCDNEFFFYAISTGEIVYPYREGIYASEVKNSVGYRAVNSYVRTMVDSRRASFVG